MLLVSLISMKKKKKKRHRAAAGGYIKIIELLVGHSCRVNPKDVQGDTPLHNACEEGHGDCAVYLIEKNGNLDQLNQQGKSPMDLCPTNQLRSFIMSSINE
jgi:ankyrin repeat protein